MFAYCIIVATILLLTHQVARCGLPPSKGNDMNMSKTQAIKTAQSAVGNLHRDASGHGYYMMVPWEYTKPHGPTTQISKITSYQWARQWRAVVVAEVAMRLMGVDGYTAEVVRHEAESKGIGNVKEIIALHENAKQAGAA